MLDFNREQKRSLNDMQKIQGNRGLETKAQSGFNSTDDFPDKASQYSAVSISEILTIDTLTDIHIIKKAESDLLAGWIRINGLLIKIPEFINDAGFPVDEWISLMSKHDIDKANDEFSMNISEKLRARVSLRHALEKKTLEIFIRIIPKNIPLVVEQLFDILRPIASPRSGIFLVSGVAGSGKSTILASLMSYYLCNSGVHVVTIEDPIEYLLPGSESGYSSQRTVGVDVDSFADGLRLSLREDPDVILVGEIRDEETARVALTAAETGHMVLSTIHAPHCFGSIDRYLSLLGNADYEAMRLSHSYIGGVHLTCHYNRRQGISDFKNSFLKNVVQDITREYEFFWNNDASRTHIREKKTHYLGQSRTVPIVRTLKS